MSTATRIVLVLFLAVATAASLSAEEKKKPNAPKVKGQKRAAATVATFLPEAVRSTLTEEQKTQVAALDKEYAGKLSEVQKARAEALSPEKRKAVAEARKDKKGKEAKAAVDALLTADEKAKMEAAQKDFVSLQKEVLGKLMPSLTDDQKSKVKLPGGKPGNAPKKKKPDNK